MSDLIDRQDAICALLEKGQRSRRYKLGEIWELNFDEIREALATVPSAEPVKHGKWIVKWSDIKRTAGIMIFLEQKCSECGVTFEDFPHNYKYCPNCGAEMLNVPAPAKEDE